MLSSATMSQTALSRLPAALLSGTQRSAALFEIMTFHFSSKIIIPVEIDSKIAANLSFSSLSASKMRSICSSESLEIFSDARFINLFIA